MISDNDLLIYARQRIIAHFGEQAELEALLVIGSFVYPEFARPNSDIDLIAVLNDCEAAGSWLDVGVASLNQQQRLVELRTFTVSQMHRYALSCDIAQSFAFVRGYRFLLETFIAKMIVDLAISRYYTDTARMWAEMRSIGLETHLSRMQFAMSDARNQINSRNVAADPLLRKLRVAETIKDFTSQIWIGHLIDKYVGTSEGMQTGADPKSPLLNEVGLLRVFMGQRGGRMVASDKYAKTADVDTLIQAIRLSCEAEVGEMMRGFEDIFVRRFNRPLFISS